MREKIHETKSGGIHYWVSDAVQGEGLTLVFLPGLTADHRLFEKQLEHFEGKYRCLVWDAPGHAASYPFELDFSLMDKAKWLEEILCAEGIEQPVIIGQSMGGYVAQAYSHQFPEKLAGFVSIDSAPLQRRYMTAFELWLLKITEPFYKLYPWKSLLKSGSKGVANTEYGRQLMYDMMLEYDGNQERYAKLSGHAFRILAEAIEADLPYELHCPVQLICGEDDRAGYCKRYNKMWHEVAGLPLAWIKDAGHNSNTDAPEEINRLIEALLLSIS